MVFKNRRKRLRVSLSEDESAEDVGEFNADDSEDSDFASFQVSSLSQDVILPSERVSVRQNAQSGSAQAWVEKYSSMSLQGGLATSGKKTKEIANWLKGALNGCSPRLLILSGPPGCGKSTAVRAAAKMVECPVSSWQAPATGVRNISMTLIDDFRSFFVGGRYPTLRDEDNAADEGDSCRNKILLVEDFPVCVTDIAQKRSMVQKIFSDAALFAPHPTVVIISDSEKGVARTAKFMFGAELLESPSVALIRVPKVTETMMKKRLRDVLQREGLSFSQDKLNGAVSLARGDIRAALNALQFCSSAERNPHASVGPSQRYAENSKRSKRMRRGEHRSFAVLNTVGQDASLGMYHAVSKILNNKRNEEGFSKYVAEDILEDARADPSSFLEFLHHNYPDFFGDIDDVVNALGCLSQADCLLPWRQDDMSRTGLWDCAASLATRGFLFHNLNPIRTGWRPIRGPESYGILKEGREHVSSAQRQFSGVLAPTVYTRSTLCETVPFCEQITQSTIKEWGIPSHDPAVRGTGITDAADIAMADMEMAEEKNIKVEPQLKPKNGMEVIRGDEDMDPIIDWDDFG